MADTTRSRGSYNMLNDKKKMVLSMKDLKVMALTVAGKVPLWRPLTRHPRLNNWYWISSI